MILLDILWFTLMIFCISLGIKFFSMYHKDKDKNKLIFSIGYFCTIVTYLYILLGYHRIDYTNIIIKGLFSWGASALVIAILFTVIIRLFNLHHKMDLILKIFIITIFSTMIYHISVISFPIFTIYMVLLSMSIIILSIALILKYKDIVSVLFLLAQIFFTISGYTLGNLYNNPYNYSEFFPIMGFYVGYIFLYLIFTLPEKNTQDKSNSLFTLQYQLNKSEKERNKIQIDLQKAYDQLADLNKNLEKKVVERTKEINHLLKQKNDFINQLGHDLKTPLGPLISLLPLLKNKIDDPKLKEMINVSIKSTERINSLVKKTLNLAQLNTPDFKLHYNTVSLNDQINQSINRTKDAPHNNTYFVNNLHKDFKLEVDEILFSELLDNILSNAVKYSPKGGKIRIDATKDMDSIIIAVKDEGIGLDEKQLNYIFDEFYKADESRHDLNSSGLGMPIAKRIVERHGGFIWAESEGIGKGSTFFISLPQGNINKNSSNIVTDISVKVDQILKEKG